MTQSEVQIATLDRYHSGHAVEIAGNTHTHTHTHTERGTDVGLSVLSDCRTPGVGTDAVSECVSE